MPTAFSIIVAVCVLVELALTGLNFAGYPAARQAAFLYGGFFPQLLDDWTGVFPGQAVVMFLTYGFLHAGPLHLIMNMLALVQLVRELTRIMSAQAMLVIYALSQIGAGLAQAALAQAGPVMVGASGAIFGLAGALFARGFAIHLRRGLPLGPLMKSGVMLIVLNVALVFLVPQIAWQAHLGGILTGALAGFALSAIGRRV